MDDKNKTSKVDKIKEHINNKNIKPVNYDTKEQKPKQSTWQEINNDDRYYSMYYDYYSK